MRMSTRTHAFLDVATAGVALLLPRVVGGGGRFTKIVTAIALGKIGYTLLTRHEGGILKLLPMKAHLTLDAVGGVTLCTLPYLLNEKQNRTVTACTLGLGLFNIAAAPLTQTQMPGDSFAITRPGDQTPSPAGRTRVSEDRRLPTASVADSLKMHANVVLPNIAKGPLIRRPRVLAMAERLDLDTRAVRTLQRMREKYGRGPLMMRLSMRQQAVILDGDHLRRVLDESPEPFATASTVKQAALAHFEPKFSLVSHGPEREARRRLNEQVLEAGNLTHHLAQRFLPIVDEEVEHLLAAVSGRGALRWDAFIAAWFRMVRRIVFGNAARDDHATTDLTARLRADGNWAFLKPLRHDLRAELHQRIRRYIDKAEAGSLAAYVAQKHTSDAQAPEHQIPQWLFAFDPAAMATYRALALLASHPRQMERARQEAQHGSAGDQPHRPLLRASVLESLRLWPTTPMILRQTTRETEWDHGIMPAHTGVLIYAPFFHRDDQTVPFAHRFNPEVWIEDDPEVTGFPPRRWPFVPFSGGTAHCPGQLLVLLLTSGWLAAIIGNRNISLQQPHRMPPARLPGSQNHFTLRFTVEPRTASVGPAAVSQLG